MRGAAHRFVELDGAQRVEVARELLGELGLPRHHLGVARLEGGVSLGELRAERVEVGDRGLHRLRLRALRAEALARRCQPRAAAVVQRDRLELVEVEAPLVVEERTHERRRDRVERRVRARRLRRRQRLGHVDRGREERRRLGRLRRARQRPPVEDEHGPIGRLGGRQRVLGERVVVGEQRGVAEQQDLDLDGHRQRRLQRRLHQTDRIALRRRHADRSAGLGLLYEESRQRRRRARRRCRRRHRRRGGAGDESRPLANTNSPALQICIFQILILTQHCSGSHVPADATRQSWASWASSSPPTSSSLTAFGRARQTHRRAPVSDLSRRSPSRRCQIESRRGARPHGFLGTALTQSRR